MGVESFGGEGSVSGGDEREGADGGVGYASSECFQEGAHELTAYGGCF